MSNVIYPPILDTYTKPVIKGSEVYKIPFTISNFNSIDELDELCIVTVNDLNTNYSVLKASTEMIFAEIKNNNGEYYIELPLNVSTIEELFINNYYKVQIRFVAKGKTPPKAPSITNEPEPLSSDAQSGDVPKIDMEWLAENQDYISEWSTITLIRVISTPSIRLKCGELDGVYRSNPFLSLPGELYFSDSNETSKLKSYRIILVGAGIDSGIQYTSKNFSSNSFQYNSNQRIDLNGETSKRYSGKIYYTLDSLYEGSYDFNIDILQNYYIIGDANIAVPAYLNMYKNKNGNIIVKASFTVSSLAYSIAIGRFCSKDNFSNLEILNTYTYTTTGVKQTITYVDKTVESGIWYKYCILPIAAEGVYGTPIETDPVMSFFEDIFLGSENKTLKIKFNPSISSYKNSVLDSKTETIGSKYAFVKRNADVNYKQFPIGGLISFLENENDIFCTKSELYNNNQDIINLYNQFNDEENINEYNDYITERFYREKVMDYLYDDNVKLFRSLTEGNILVKLMDVNLTPNTTLGRYIYSFSANAIEIDECNIDNYKKYNIIE